MIVALEYIRTVQYIYTDPNNSMGVNAQTNMDTVDPLDYQAFGLPEFGLGRIHCIPTSESESRTKQFQETRTYLIYKFINIGHDS